MIVGGAVEPGSSTQREDIERGAHGGPGRQQSFEGGARALGVADVDATQCAGQCDASIGGGRRIMSGGGPQDAVQTRLEDVGLGPRELHRNPTLGVDDDRRRRQVTEQRATLVVHVIDQERRSHLKLTPGACREGAPLGIGLGLRDVLERHLAGVGFTLVDGQEQDVFPVREGGFKSP